MGFLIEYDGDETDILHKALAWITSRPSAHVAQVTLRPSNESHRSITSVADYLVEDYREGQVSLTLFDHFQDDLKFRNPDGGVDIQRVRADDIAEIHFY